jgi:hypothetical protein
MVDSTKNMFPSISFFPADFAGQRVLDKDPTGWLDGARPQPKICLQLFKIIIVKLYVEDLQCGDKTIWQWNCQIVLYGVTILTF